MKKTLEEIFDIYKAIPNTLVDGLPAEWGGDKGGTHSYIKTYSNLFDSIRDENLCILEIGVLYGSSVKMWKDYFANSKIVGVDIRESCLKYAENNIDIHILNAANCNEVCDKLNLYKFNIVIDDGSHQLNDQDTTFRCMTQYLTDEFIYIIEDIQNIDLAKSKFSDDFYKNYNIKFVDLRGEKGRYDDVLIIITNKIDITKINRGSNKKDYWEMKHINQYEVNKEFDYSKMGELSYIKIANDIISTNKHSIRNKKILDIGCAVGKAVNYYKMNLPEFDCSGIDFSQSAIDSARLKVQNATFECKDIIENPIDENFGVITMLETIEHFQEGINYSILNNLLSHSEYVIISTVDTEDDCFGEHISHYKLNTFNEKGYNVLWKEYLDEIQMPTGIFHYMIFLIKGDL